MINNSSSIHPRVQGGATRHEKSHTSRKKLRSTIERKIAGVSRHLEEHPNNSVAAAYLKKLENQLRAA